MFLLLVMVLYMASKHLPNKIGASCITMHTSHVCSKVLCQIHLPNWNVLPKKNWITCTLLSIIAHNTKVGKSRFTILPVQFTTQFRFTVCSDSLHTSMSSQERLKDRLKNKFNRLLHSFVPGRRVSPSPNRPANPSLLVSIQTWFTAY